MYTRPRPKQELIKTNIFCKPEMKTSCQDFGLSNTDLQEHKTCTTQDYNKMSRFSYPWPESNPTGSFHKPLDFNHIGHVLLPSVVIHNTLQSLTLKAPYFSSYHHHYHYCDFPCLLWFWEGVISRWDFAPARAYFCAARSFIIFPDMRRIDEE